MQSFAVAEDSTPEIDGDVKAIAFYLPQFHPIPENDAWWGKGFTEWTNVTKAQPQFAGHHQPQLPGELGFYDLRLSDIRDQQAQLAREYGLHGFCYYYYWFSGRRILERPLRMMLDAGTPDFPFCICWANENWTRTWDGLEADVLLHQEHTPASDLAFIKDVLPILKDPRYIRVNGAPLLLVYRVSLLPTPARTSALWRQACREAGLETIHLCAVETAGTPEPPTIGFDSTAQFPPHNLQTRRSESTVADLNPLFTGQIHNYEWTVAEEMTAPPESYRRFRGVMPSWDNTARRGPASNIFVNSSPEAYEVWLKSVVDATKRDLPPSERLLFINAWNEWAEGAHLEPDQKFGRRYLEATRRALTRT
ncbi:MAG: glycoside hydrolase family 99-like domain-containing protein, partial [Planctomycetota bacterium]